MLIKALYTISCHQTLYLFMSQCIFHPFWCQSRHFTPYPATRSYTYLSIIASFTHSGAYQGTLHHILPPNPIPIYELMHLSPILVLIKALYTIPSHHTLYLFKHYCILLTFGCQSRHFTPYPATTSYTYICAQLIHHIPSLCTSTILVLI